MRVFMFWMNLINYLWYFNLYCFIFKELVAFIRLLISDYYRYLLFLSQSPLLFAILFFSFSLLLPLLSFLTDLSSTFNMLLLPFHLLIKIIKYICLKQKTKPVSFIFWSFNSSYLFSSSSISCNFYFFSSSLLCLS